MKVFHWEQIGGALVEPLGTGSGLAAGAVAVAARVVGDALVAATVALLDMSAQLGRAAADQVTQHAALLGGGHLAVNVQEGGRVATQDVSQFQRFGRHGPWLPAVVALRKSSGLRVAATRSGEM